MRYLVVTEFQRLRSGLLIKELCKERCITTIISNNIIHCPLKIIDILSLKSQISIPKIRELRCHKITLTSFNDYKLKGRNSFSVAIKVFRIATSKHKLGTESDITQWGPRNTFKSHLSYIVSIIKLTWKFIYCGTTQAFNIRN